MQVFFIGGSMKKIWLVLLLSYQTIASHQYSNDKIHPEHVRDMLNYILYADKDELKSIRDQYGIDTHIDKVLYIKKGLLSKNKLREKRLSAIDNISVIYQTMDELSLDNNSLEQRLIFMKNLSRKEIMQIYNVRKLYDVLSYSLGFAVGPYMHLGDMNGIYQGRSSIWFGNEKDRTFQKIFYTIEKDGQTYHVGHNVSNAAKPLASNGCFRVYEAKYPTYPVGGLTKWHHFQPGSLGISYEKKDLLPVFGKRLDQNYPQLAHYNRLYHKGKQKRALGFFFYGRLKDELIKINDAFIIAYAERPLNPFIPGGHFIATKKAGLVPPKYVPNSFMDDAIQG